MPSLKNPFGKKQNVALPFALIEKQQDITQIYSHYGKCLKALKSWKEKMKGLYDAEVMIIDAMEPMTGSDHLKSMNPGLMQLRESFTVSAEQKKNLINYLDMVMLPEVREKYKQKSVYQEFRHRYENGLSKVHDLKGKKNEQLECENDLKFQDLLNNMKYQTDQFEVEYVNTLSDFVTAYLRSLDASRDQLAKTQTGLAQMNNEKSPKIPPPKLLYDEYKKGDGELTRKKVIYKHDSKFFILGTGPYWGIKLEEVLNRVDETGSIPDMVQIMLRYIHENGLKAQGIFRIAGAKQKMEELKELIEQGSPVDLEAYSPGTYVHIVAGLLKQYIRELPDPLIPLELRNQFLDVLRRYTELEDQLLAVKDLILQIPISRRVFLGELFALLHPIQLHSDENMMDSKNLAIIFGMNIIEGSTNKSSMNLSILPRSQQICRFLIDYYPELKDEYNSSTSPKEVIVDQGPPPLPPRGNDHPPPIPAKNLTAKLEKPKTKVVQKGNHPPPPPPKKKTDKNENLIESIQDNPNENGEEYLSNPDEWEGESFSDGNENCNSEEYVSNPDEFDTNQNDTKEGTSVSLDTEKVDDANQSLEEAALKVETLLVFD